MEKIIVGSGEILRKRRMGVKFTVGGVSTGILTFPKSVFSVKVMYQIWRREGNLVGGVVVWWGTGSNTGAEAAKDIRHELVTGIARKELLNFLLKENVQRVCKPGKRWKLSLLIEL